MAKSLSVALPDGSVMEADDPLSLLKASDHRLRNLEGTLRIRARAIDAKVTEGDLAKSLKVFTTPVGLVKEQAGRDKSTQAGLEDLQDAIQHVDSPSSSRRSTATMAKAMRLFDKGKLNATDIAAVELRMGRGARLPRPSQAPVRLAGDDALRAHGHVCRQFGGRVLMAGDKYLCGGCGICTTISPNGICGCGIRSPIGTVSAGRFQSMSNNAPTRTSPTEIVISFNGGARGLALPVG